MFKTATPHEKGSVYNHGCKLSRLALCMQVFRTEIISRRLNKSATLPLMSAALTTVAGIMAVAAVCTHPKVMHHSSASHSALICPVLKGYLGLGIFFVRLFL